MSTPLLPNPSEAWLPLPTSQWNADCARHLLRRAGFASLPSEVARAERLGMSETVARLFASPAPLPTPPLVAKLAEDLPELQAPRQGLSPEERAQRQRVERERLQAGVNDFALRWLEHAARPERSASEKFVLFLQNVLVVGATKVRNPILLVKHQEILREGSRGPYPDLCKAITRSAAMAAYLDLAQNRPTSPNENFARELFELFILGEGNYTEQDIKEATKAFTNYRIRRDSATVQPPSRREQMDITVFGRRGRWTGDQVIDLAFTQPAAATFLPKELCRFYLSESPLPAAHLEALGEFWRREDFRLDRLIERVFSSRLFYAPQFRGQLIKSPLDYYLGLIQDLALAPEPYPRPTLNFLRQMGQPFFDPPNVRGWVGGRLWINSATLAARQQLVDHLFSPLNEERMNADDQRALAAARETNPELRLRVETPRFEPIARAEPEQITRQLIERFLAASPSPAFQAALNQRLGEARNERQRLPILRDATVALLQTPEYNLC
jgi:uncharacterized protein (DUF1800 family)